MDKDGVTLYPTGTCFNDAIEFLEELAVKGSPPPWRPTYWTINHKLAHGVCLLPNGEEYAHAWVEINGNEVAHAAIIDGAKVYVHFSLVEFKAKYRVVRSTVYAVREVWELNKKSGTYGPWELGYLRLCKDYKHA